MAKIPLVRQLKVVGTFYRSKEEKAKLATLVGCGDPVPCAFKVETDNAHDSYAVAVYCKVPPHAPDGAGEWVHAGYVPATVSALFGAAIKGNETALEASCDVSIEKNIPAIILNVALEEAFL